MGANVLFLGWKRSTPGREQQTQQLLGKAVQYCGKLKQDGRIEDFDSVILMPHGGDLNGFIVVRGEPKNLDEIMGSDDFLELTANAGHNVDGFRAVRGFSNEEAKQVIASWGKLFA